mmetsp:Transcript_13611/g.27200  ORF Transcript_13611/g.27200 Transcript_13611/m.27200 type:complete len:235 (-) Transcript_13611:28-732(-)
MRSPAPFLNKLYELVSDPFTDNLVSWEKNGQCFVVYKPTEFSLMVLPLYFKHNNFSSFIRQLNQYGFSKLHPDEWIFGHHNFKWGQRERLLSINRKKKENFKEINNPTDPAQNFGNKLFTEIDLLKRYRQVLTKDILDVCRRQEHFLIRQQHLESLQKKLESEVNHLKSFIFGYFSRIISTDYDLEKSLNCIYPEKKFKGKFSNRFKRSSNFKPRLNLSYEKSSEKTFLETSFK